MPQDAFGSYINLPGGKGNRLYSDGSAWEPVEGDITPDTPGYGTQVRPGARAGWHVKRISLTGQDVYKKETADTYDDGGVTATSLATGEQWKIIIVLSDETDGGETNRYYYEGTEGKLDLIF